MHKLLKELWVFVGQDMDLIRNKVSFFNFGDHKYQIKLNIKLLKICLIPVC